MSFIQSKSIYVYIISCGLIVLGCLLYLRVNLSAYEDKEDIILEFSSISKVKNIYQSEDNDTPITTYGITFVVYDKNMVKIQDLKDKGVSEYNENMIRNIQYARSGRLNLPKENIVNMIKSRIKGEDIRYVKFYWGVSNSYFPITCTFENDKIKECVEISK